MLPVVQAALMAQHDSKSPAIIVAASAVFSLVCDVVLIAGCGWGLTGAALATVAAQYISLAACLYVCYQPGSLRPIWPWQEVRLQHLYSCARVQRLKPFRASSAPPWPPSHSTSCWQRDFVCGISWAA
jgi:Na+-driven multidrug efflux pump